MISYALILGYYFPNAEYILNGEQYSDLLWLSNTPKPTQLELDALWEQTQQKELKLNCKQQASKLLSETDWTIILDVSDPTNSPYLTNQAEFIAWRNQIRSLAINPVIDPIFPPKPDEVWG
jgi:hypothetical protein